MSEPLWRPSGARARSTNITSFREFLEARGHPVGGSYGELWEWSVAHQGPFWTAIWDFCGVRGERGKRAMADAERMPGCRYFPDARLNFAENLLRRADDRTAVIARREDGRSRSLSWAELHRETARLAAALRARDLQSQINDMVNALIDLNGQVDALLESIDGKELTNEGTIRTKAGEAKEQMAGLENELRRPLPRMGYRQWPRLSEQIGSLARGINQAQARPTEGQLEVLTEIEVAAEQRAHELTTLINTTISELNDLLEEAPKIMAEWRATRRIS